MEYSGAFVVVSYEDRQFEPESMRIEGVYDTFELAEKSISEYHEFLQQSDDNGNFLPDYSRYFGIEQFQRNKLGCNNYYIAWSVFYYQKQDKWICDGVRNIGSFHKFNLIRCFVVDTVTNASNVTGESIYSVYVQGYSQEEALETGKKLILSAADLTGE